MFRLVLGLAAALVLTNIGNHYLTKWFSYAAGKRDVERVYEAAAQAEKVRQESVIARENETTRGKIEAIGRQITNLEQTMKENDNEASADPDADGCGLSASGSVRVDKVR